MDKKMIICELDSKDYTLDDILNAQTLLSKGELSTFHPLKEFKELTQFFKEIKETEKEIDLKKVFS